MATPALLARGISSRLLHTAKCSWPKAFTMHRPSSFSTKAQQQDTPEAASTATPPARSIPPRPAAGRPLPGRPPPGRPAPGRPSPGAQAGSLVGPDGKPLEVVSVENTGADAWAGVAAIDDGKAFDFNRALFMAGGDVLALFAFACIGRINHGGVLDFETVYTAAPFIAGWLAAAPLLGGYSREAQGSEVGPAALAAAKVWAVATPLGLALRGLSKGYIPPTSFIIVSLVATAVVMVGWRSALAAATPKGAPQSAAQQIAARKDKKGNPFEFVQLLMSLTKRW